MTNRRLLLALLLSVTCPTAWAQFPAGGEFQVNSYTTGSQRGPAVASDANGNFVVVWDGCCQDGNYPGIFGQRFNAAGVPQGGEFQVDTSTHASGLVRDVEVASDASGNFVVVWGTVEWYGWFALVLGQRFNAAGVPQGGEFQVGAGRRRSYPAVASDASGNFVVVWQDWTLGGIFGQRFNAAGVPQGGEFHVNLGPESNPAVASDANGNFVVVWGSGSSQTDVFGQRFNASGVPQGTEFQVNTYTTGQQDRPRVASDASGNFVVVWESSGGQDGSAWGIFGQRFNASSVPEGSEFQVNSYTTGYQTFPAVASEANGNFVVVWHSPQDGSGWGIFGQRFNASGVPQGTEFEVNTYTTGQQDRPRVVSDARGNFVVVWESDGQDGSAFGVFGQRFGDLIFRDGFE